MKILEILQQSRLLAFLSNYDRFLEIQEGAMNSEDAGLIQSLKTMDSITTKWTQLQTAFQEFYTSTGVQDLIKGILDAVTTVLNRLNTFSKAFGKLPVLALVQIGVIVKSLKTAATLMVTHFSNGIEQIKAKFKQANTEVANDAQQKASGVFSQMAAERQKYGGGLKGVFGALKGGDTTTAAMGTALSAIGSFTSMAGLSAKNSTASAWGQGIGSLISGAGNGLLTFVRTMNPVLAVISGLATAIPGLVSAFQTGIKSTEEKLKEVQQSIEDSKNQALLSKDELRTLTEYEKKLKEAKAAQYDSVEAKQEYYNLMNEIADKYPQLITNIDDEKNAIVELGDSYKYYKEQKEQAYFNDTIEAAAKTISARRDEDYRYDEAASNIIPDLKDTYGEANLSAYLNYQSIFKYFDEHLGAQWEDYFKSLAENDINGLTTRGVPRGILQEIYPDLDFEAMSIEELQQKVVEVLSTSSDPLIQILNAIKNTASSYNDYVKKSDRATYENVVRSYASTKGIKMSDFEVSGYVDKIQADIDEQIQGKDRKAAEPIIENFLKYRVMSGEVFTQYDNIFKTLTDKQKEALDELDDKSATYSTNELREKVIDIVGEDNPEIITAIMDYFASLLEWTKEDFVEALRQRGGAVSQSLIDNLSTASQQKMIGLMDKAKNDDQKDRYQVLYQGVSSITDSDARRKVENVINNADLTSFTGIGDAMAELNKLDLPEGMLDATLKSLNNLKDTIDINFETEIGSFIENLGKKTEQFNEMFQKIGKGVENFSTALNYADAMDVDFDKAFSFRDGKYFLNDEYYQAFEDYYFKLNQDMVDELVKRIQEDDDLTTEEKNKYIDNILRAARESAAYTVNAELLQARNYLAFGERDDILKEGASAQDFADAMKKGDIKKSLALMTDEARSTYANTLIDLLSGDNTNLINSILDGMNSKSAAFEITASSDVLNELKNNGFDIIAETENGAFVSINNIADAYAYLDQKLAEGSFKPEDYNAIRKTIADTKFSAPVANAVSSFEDIHRITEQELIAYADSVGVSAKDLEAAMTKNADGTYRATLGGIKNAVYGVGNSLADVGVDAQTYVENLTTYLDGLGDLFDKAINGATFSEAFKIAGSRGKSITELFERDGDKYFLKSGQTDEFVNGYLQSILNGLEAYGAEISNDVRDEATKAAKEQAASALSDNGNYLEALQVYFYGNKEMQEKIAQAYKKGDVDTLREMTKGYDVSGNIIDAMGNQVKDVYTDVIDALQNGGLLKAESGTRDIYQRLASNGLLTKVGQDLYKVSENTGLQFLQAITEEMVMTEDQLADTISSNIQNLAENANLASFAREVQENAQKATGKVRNAWLDGINSIFTDATGRIANGINGSASANDISTLEKQFGFNISYKRTEEGFKIKQDSLNQIYNTLLLIDNISASVALKEMVSSAMESEEALNDVWYVMNKIEKIEKELANPKISDKRKKELEAELDVAQGIYDTLKKADGTFNFMDRSLPSGYDEPLSAWEGVNDAFKVLESDSYKKGYVTVQDFTNMITMMGDDVLRSCGIFNDEISTSADLLLAANSAITRVDGEVVVNLSQLGVNFNVGADNMKKGVMDGIHTLAEQQIAILDAEIEMLQTVVKTQEAFDKLKGDKTELTADDFLPHIEKLPNGITLPPVWKENQEEAVGAIDKFMGGMVLQCGMTVHEAAQSPEAWALLSDADRQLMASVGNALNQNDWVGMTGEVAQMLQDKINTALQEGGYDYRIKIDMSKLNVSFASGEINWDDEALAPLLDYKDKIEAYLKEHPEQATVSLNDLIKIAAGDDEELASSLKQQLTTTVTTVTDELNPAINESKTGMEDTKNAADEVAATEFDNLTKAAEDTAKIAENLRKASIYAGLVKSSKKFQTTYFDDGTGGSANGGSGKHTTANGGGGSTTFDFDEIAADLQSIYDKLKDITGNSKIVETIENLVKELDKFGKSLSSIPATKASNEMKVLQASIAALRSKAITLGATIILKVQATGAIKGTVGTIKQDMGTGRTNTSSRFNNTAASAKGTLMGELGPELVVSNGRYFTVGENGAEFVSLAEDAIVFNHLQTKQLLGKGSTGRGHAVTNEKNATSYATGNAKASAAEALQELINIRAQWQALLNKSAKDLGNKAGGGGGGGGNDPKTITHDLERWYNLLRQIEKLEQKITLQQAKRANMKNGYDYVDSLETELALLRKQQKAYSDLARLQKDYYDRRRKDLLSTDYSKIFTYDEDGLMQYVDGENRGLDILAKLQERNPNGDYVNAAVNSTSQLAYLKFIGFDTSNLNFNADGSTAEDDDQRMQNFWDNLDAWMEELDGLYDEYNEHLQNVEENTSKQNEILQEYIDNQLAVESKILTAIEDREQAIIDKLQDEKDALEDASDKYIEGLNQALKKEKNLYNRNQDAAETARLQRQLAILQRSGASTSEIKSLKDQIDSRLKDDYFDKMQEQIDTVQEASEKQLEKLQTQIDLMTETLEYQKENGLLWQEVYEMMNNWTPEKILQFIEEYTKSYRENSNLQNEENSKETLKQLQEWDAKKTRDKDWEDYYNNLDSKYDSVKEAKKQEAYWAYSEGYASGGKEQAEANANAIFDAALNGGKKPSTTPSAGDSGSTTPTPTPEPEPATRKAKFKNKNYKVYSYDTYNTKTKGFVVYGNGDDSVQFEMFDEKGERILVSGTDGKGQKIEKRWVPKKYFQYKEGGLVDFTGPAWVDGTKQRPEAFLSAEDTKLLKSKIFSKSDYSLKSAVEAIESMTKSLSGLQAGGGSNITIEHAEVNIEPGTISNDYDARRAGEMALEEMVKIARKSGNRTVSRR